MNFKLSILCVSLLTSITAKSQTREIEVKADLAPAARTLPYKSFPIQDPRTGKALKNNEKIKLNDGREVTAGDYYKAVNDSERYLTGRGHSLRDRKDNYGVVADIKSTEATKSKQMNQIKASLVSQPAVTQLRGLSPLSGPIPVLRAAGSSTLTPVNLPAPVLLDGGAGGGLTTLRPGKFDFPVLIDATGSNVPCTTRTVLDRSASKTTPMGDRSSASLKVATSLRIEAGCERYAGTANASADAALLNNDIPIFRTRIFGESRPGLSNSVDVDVFFAGKKLFDFDQSGKLSIVHRKTFQHNYDKSFRGRASVGPIPVSFTLGGNGNASLSFVASLNASTVLTEVNPNMRIRAYAEGAVDIIIARGGIGAELLIMSLSMPISGTASRGFENGRHLALTSINATSNLSALSGRVFLFGELNLIFFRPRFEANLVNWSGFNVNGTLLKQDDRLAI